MLYTFVHWSFYTTAMYALSFRCYLLVNRRGRGLFLPISSSSRLDRNDKLEIYHCSNNGLPIIMTMNTILCNIVKEKYYYRDNELWVTRMRMRRGRETFSDSTCLLECWFNLVLRVRVHFWRWCKQLYDNNLSTLYFVLINLVTRSA